MYNKGGEQYMSFWEIIDRERENLTMLILTLLTFLLIKQFNEQTIKESIYILLIYFGWIILNYFFGKIIILRRIKISHSNEMYEEKIDVLEKGEIFYGFLDVEIPEKWVITDCYVTLERKKPIYYEDRTLIREDHSEWYSEIGKPEYKMLHWRSPLSNQEKTKISIGENTNREAFSVGKIITGKLENVEINTFSFDMHRKKPGEIDFNHFGLYEFTIIFHWKRNNRNMISKKVDGYIYTRSLKGLREIRVGVGNYKDDKRVPAPI